MFRRIALLGAACLLLAAGEAPRPVRVQTVAFAAAHPAITLSGTVQARIQADLAFRVAGKVIARPVETGDHVVRGQVLARIDPADLRYSLESADAALQSAEADLAQANADLRRYDALGRSSPAYLPSEYDRRLAAQRMAAARVVQAQRQRALAHDQLDYGVLTADADGVLTALPVQVGQVVAAGQTVATIAHAGDVEIVADVPENRLAALRAARDITIRLWAFPALSLHGRLREIGALADPASRTFTVKVAVLDPPPDTLALGMTATIGLDVPGPRLAVLPAAALTDQHGEPAVWVLDPRTGHAALRRIGLAGTAPDGSLLVASGLAAGEQVITAGVRDITADLSLTAWAGPAR
jgi:RND family efflux transporter MFP subunit